MLNIQLKQTVQLPNGLTGTVIEISGLQKVNGMTAPLKKAKVRYNTPTGQVEAWYPFGKLQAVKIVAVSVEPEVEPVMESESKIEIPIVEEKKINSTIDNDETTYIG